MKTLSHSHISFTSFVTFTLHTLINDLERLVEKYCKINLCAIKVQYMRQHKDI